jgi:hypothetical protein
MSDSSRSFSSASLGHVGVTIVVLKLQCITSLGRTAIAPYIGQNGMKFVALHTVVLWLHTACGVTFTHFPFFSPSRIFFDCFEYEVIGSFHCSVGLGVVHRCKGNLRSNPVAEVLEYCVVKIFYVVNSDVLWYTIEADDILPK